MASFKTAYSNLLNITNGTSVGIGGRALLAQTTNGAYNTCIGYEAGLTITSNDYNTCIGCTADVALTTGRATVIGSTASLRVASTSTGSVAIGYGATSTVNGVCVMGLVSDHVRVVEYGPHFGIHYNETHWPNLTGVTQTYSTNSTAINFATTQGYQIVDGMISMFHLGTLGGASTMRVNILTATQVMSWIPNCQVGTAFYLKIGSYQADRTSILVTVAFGTGWTTYGGLTFPESPQLNGCINFLCIVTNVLTPAISAYSAG